MMVVMVVMAMMVMMAMMAPMTTSAATPRRIPPPAMTRAGVRAARAAGTCFSSRPSWACLGGRSTIASSDRQAGSIPFFDWYQFVWIGVSAVLTAVVYFATRNDAER